MGLAVLRVAIGNTPSSLVQVDVAPLGFQQFASALAGQLKRLAPNLREAGWSVDYQRQSSRRLWTIRRMTAATTSVASSGVTATAGCSLQSDAKRCDPYSDDADDGDDAVLQATEMDLEPNESWEEGSL